MITIPSPRPIAIIAGAGAIVALLSALLFPGFVIAQVGVAFLSAGCLLWGFQLMVTARRHRMELGRARWYRMTIKQLIAAAPAATPGSPRQLYLGTGAFLQNSHGQALYDLSGTNRNSIPQDERTKGDNRVVGIAWQDLKPICIDERDANVHFLIFGATGRGKSRIAEIIALQAILRERVMTTIVDPKGDPMLRRRMQAAAKRAGVPFYLVDFADPEHSATYNPIRAGEDPDQVGDQIAQLCDGGGEAASYWRGRAANTARIVSRAMESVRLYLESCGGSGSAPPPELSAVERARGHATLPAFFTPFGWYPRLSVLDVFGVTAAYRLLGWMMRIVYADRLEKAPDAPDFADKKMIAAWWEAYLSDRSHLDDQHPVRGPLLAKIRIQMQQIRDLMDRDDDELAKANSSLFEALERFRGRVSRITDTPTPDIVWDKMAEQRAVVYFSLAAQEYSDLAMGFARILCADLSAWCGKRSRQEKASPWYLIADEVDRWIPSFFPDFLARGRSAGLRCIAIGQTRASFAERLGPHGREIVEGNAGTVFQFAAKGPVDAAAAAKYAGTARVVEVRLGATTSIAQGASGQGSIGGHQTSQSVQTHAQDVDLFPAWAVQNLPTGTALVITQAGPAIIAFPEIVDEKF